MKLNRIKNKNKVKTPTVLQMEAVECGAASLGMILGYYKKFVGLTQLRIDCHVSRDGSRASQIVEAAQNYGLISQGFSRQALELNALKTPFIAFWDNCHFLVVEGFHKNHVYLNDPASGRRRISFSEFEENYSGVVLTFEPSPSFETSGKNTYFMAAIGRRLNNSQSKEKFQFRFLFFFLFLVNIIIIATGIIIATLIKLYIDEFIIASHVEILTFILIGLTLAAILRGSFTALKLYFMNRIEKHLSFKESSEFLNHILHLPIDFFYQRSPTDIFHRMESSHNIGELIIQSTVTPFFNMMRILFSLLFMYYLSPFLCLISLFTGALKFILLKYASFSCKDLNKQLEGDREKLMDNAVYSVGMIETVKASGLENLLYVNYIEQYKKISKILSKIFKFSSLNTSVLFLIQQLNFIFILILGSYLLIHNQLSLGALVAFSFLALNIIGPYEELLNFILNLDKIKNILNQLDDVLDYSVENAGKLNNMKIKGKMEFQNVTFGYDSSSSPILNNVNFKIKEGQCFGVVGDFSSGCSTLARLSVGLIRPLKGNVLLDGKPLCDYSLEILNKSIIYLSSDFHENFAEGKDSSNLFMSRGEKQLFALEKALECKPKIIIFDNALGSVNDDLQIKWINKIKKTNCTIILISNSSELLKICDNIFNLNLYFL